MATGVLRSDGVWVDGPTAQRLHGKGHMGTPQSGDRLRLAVVEAAYAVHAGRLDVDGHDLVSLLAAGGAAAEVAYLAYADLRDRGLVVRPGEGGALEVWDRGGHPPQAATWRCHARSEREAAAPTDLAAWAEAGDRLAVVDEDGVVTYYELALARPEGTATLPRPGSEDPHPAAAPPQGPATGGPPKARLLHDRIHVPGPPPAPGVGTPHGDGTLLSFTEAVALARDGLLRIDASVAERAADRQHHFTRTIPVYLELRDHGVLARSGFRFGTHLRGYSGPPDAGHAEWLVQCVRPDDRLHWSEVSRAVRLAHGVRKTFLLAVIDPVRYVAVTWARP